MPVATLERSLWLDPQPVTQRGPPERREIQGPRIVAPPHPPLLQERGAHRCADGTGEVRPVFRPVQTRAQDRPPAAEERFDVHTDRSERAFRLSGGGEAAVAPSEIAAPEERVGHRDAQPAGEVVVTRPRRHEPIPHRRGSQRCDVAPGGREPAERLEGRGDRRTREPVAALPTARLGEDQAAIDQRREVRAGRRGRDAGASCEGTRGMRTAVEQGVKDGRARWAREEPAEARQGSDPVHVSTIRETSSS
jgi:hypothetical protein